MALIAIRRLNDVPIRRKLLLLSMVTSVVALLIACAAFSSYELGVFRESMAEDLTSTASMVAANSAAALTFNDRNGAADLLRSLQTHPHIVAAVLYDTQDQQFAEFRRPDVSKAFHAPGVQPDGYRFTDQALGVFHKVSVDDEPLGTLYIESDLKAAFARLRRYALIVAGVLAVASLVTFGLSSWLQTVISRPIAHLADTMRIVTDRRDFSVRATAQGTDELGQLTNGLNSMLTQIQQQDRQLQDARVNLEQRVVDRTVELTTRTEELQREIGERRQAQIEVERVQRELLTASRSAGMAEVASNTLHNVGNVLTSATMSANLITSSVQRINPTSLAKVLALLEEHQENLGEFVTSHPQGRHLPAHLINLMRHLGTEFTTILGEVDGLRANVDHIRDIVTTQQTYAKASGIEEIVRISSLLEDSLRMNAGALMRHGVELVRDLQSDPFVNLDKHRVLQILVNVIRNAKYACDETNEPNRQIIVRVTEQDDRVRIAIIDNGVGIPAENLTRIFNHGFTTREHGHGFGLHGGAIAAQELGGSLTAHSDGPGRGACFTLDLPVHHGETLQVKVA